MELEMGMEAKKKNTREHERSKKNKEWEGKIVE